MIETLDDSNLQVMLTRLYKEQKGEIETLSINLLTLLQMLIVLVCTL